MLHVEPQNDFTHLGVLAHQLHRSVREIEVACMALNILPARRENGVPIFDAEQVARITERLASATPLPKIQDPRHTFMPELPSRPF
jgi:hypothetical protein